MDRVARTIEGIWKAEIEMEVGDQKMTQALCFEYDKAIGGVAIRDCPDQ